MFSEYSWGVARRCYLIITWLTIFSRFIIIMLDLTLGRGLEVTNAFTAKLFISEDFLIDSMRAIHAKIFC